MKPNTDFCTIVRTTRIILDEFINTCSILEQKNIVEKVVQKVINFMSIKKPDILNALTGHSGSELTCHRTVIIRKVVTCYVCVQLHHLAKQTNIEMKGKKIRHKFNKLVVFKNQ